MLLAVLMMLPPLYLTAADPQGASEVLRGKLKPERFISRNLPFGGRLRRTALELRYLGGQREFGGLFVYDGGLMENFQPVDQFLYSNENIRVINEVASAGVLTYVMLLPTACAVLQHHTPRFAPLYDQKRFIESTYRTLAGSATTIDAYPVLFANSDQSVFYRTDRNPTAYGGYLIYQTAAARMNLRPRPLQAFSTKYAEHGYLGDLAAGWQLGGVKPDILSLYLLQTPSKAYTVTHFSAEGNRVYHTLYPEQFLSLGEPYRAYLGGISPHMEIAAKGGDTSGKLLVFGDRTAAAYLPFFATHYERITFLDLKGLQAEEVERIRIGEYDQVLFAYSLDTFMNGSVCEGAQTVLTNEK